MLTNFSEILILSFVQGFSEFIPISSSAHLVILSNLAKFTLTSLEIDVSLHLGSLFAILFYFKKDLTNLLKNKKLLNLILFGSIPIMIVGYFLHYTGLIDYLRNIEVIAWTTLIFGILLFISDKFKIEKKIEKDLNIRSVLIIGLFQTLALIPGVSRSGITITAGRLLNFDRYEASKISFFLSIPALAGASILGLKDISNQGFEYTNSIIFSILLSFFFFIFYN